MIEVKCVKCGEELLEPGALIFSPPTTVAKGWVWAWKSHVCVKCWGEVCEACNILQAFAGNRTEKTKPKTKKDKTK